jgi:hypothetical protein
MSLTKKRERRFEFRSGEWRRALRPVFMGVA